MKKGHVTKTMLNKQGRIETNLSAKRFNVMLNSGHLKVNKAFEHRIMKEKLRGYVNNKKI